MSTQTVIDEIKLKAPAWARDGATSLLQILDRCQKTLFSRACNVTVYVDPDTGQHPFLATDGSMSYNVPDVIVLMDGIPRTLRISKVLEVYVKTETLNEYRDILVDPQRQGSAIYSEVREDRMIVRCNLVAATEVNPARIMFGFDPGTETEKYRYKALLEPLRLTEETIPLSVPEIWEPDLIDAVNGWIEKSDYGRSDRWNSFLNDSCQRFWAQNSEGNHTGKVVSTPPRPF